MMTEQERQLLIKANQELLKRRQRYQAGPKPIDRPIPALVENTGQTTADVAYFEALRNAQPGHAAEQNPDREVIQGQRAYWDSFNSDRHPDLQKAVKVVKRWYNDRLDSGGGLILAGNWGSGKSHLAKAIWELYGSGAIFWNEIVLLKTIQGGYGGKGRTEESIYGDIRRARLLIYDDLGAYPTNSPDWLQSVYYNLFDGRLEAKLATLITTNLPLKADNAFPLEERVGSRVFSRLVGQLGTMDYYVDMFAVPDYRKRNFNGKGKEG